MPDWRSHCHRHGCELIVVSAPVSYAHQYGAVRDCPECRSASREKIEMELRRFQRWRRGFSAPASRRDVVGPDWFADWPSFQRAAFRAGRPCAETPERP